jgi:hypothetical protein
MDNSVDQKTFDTVAQLSHVGWGVFFVFAPKVLFAGKTYLYIMGLWIVYAAIKEFWYDNKYETPVVRGSSLKDFLFQAGSSVVAFLLLVLTHNT